MPDLSLAGAFLAGIVSFLSPCVLPLVPAYLGFLAGASLSAISDTQAATRGVRRGLLIRALAFVAGFATVFVLLGATASLLGQALSRAFDGLAVVAGLLLVVLGVHMTGLIRIPLLMREARPHTDVQPTAIAGAYVIGLAFGFGWTPCVGPVLAAILMLSAGTDTIGRGVALLSAYAAGIGLPFILAAAYAGPVLRALSRVKRHLVTIERAAGIVLIVTGALIATGQMARLGGWLLEAAPWLGRIG